MQFVHVVARGLAGEFDGGIPKAGNSLEQVAQGLFTVDPAADSQNARDVVACHRRPFRASILLGVGTRRYGQRRTG